jgi:pimeloyl-ACP methyl ester carboxylesterase
MGVPRFIVRLLRQAPDKRMVLRSLALGGKGGNRTVISADATEIAVRRTGDGEPIVLVHGSLDGMGAFSLVELQLADDHCVWVYDRRGRGASADGSEYSLDLEVEDLRSVVAATGGAPHVVAHSFGAVIALQGRLAGVPMRSLTVYEPPINGDAIDPQQIADLRLALEDGRIDDAIRLMGHGIAGITHEEMAIAMKVPPVRKSLRDGVRVVVREIEAIRTCDWSAPLPLNDVPTLILRGERSSAAVYLRHEQMAEIAPDAEVAVLADQGHLAHVFAPAAFGTTVLEFVDRR